MTQIKVDGLGQARLDCRFILRAAFGNLNIVQTRDTVRCMCGQQVLFSLGLNASILEPIYAGQRLFFFIRTASLSIVVQSFIYRDRFPSGVSTVFEVGTGRRTAWPRDETPAPVHAYASFAIISRFGGRPASIQICRWSVKQLRASLFFPSRLSIMAHVRHLIWFGNKYIHRTFVGFFINKTASQFHPLYGSRNRFANYHHQSHNFSNGFCWRPCFSGWDN